ncbi:MAG: L-2-hydroxyglutarate oxidase [Candidatus Omnitrophota bacterium]
MQPDTLSYDVTIVGGGIVGLASIFSLVSRFPDHKFLLLEKEPQLAAHQTSHNSGVIHSGIYYRPGSLKARLCREGAEALEAFCLRYAIPYRRCGKVIVATEPSELPRLEALFERGKMNGLKGLEFTGPERLREIEPHAAGLKAIYVPSAGLVDFGEVTQQYAALAKEKGAEIRTATRLDGLLRRPAEWILRTNQGEFRTRFLINCGGLHSDRIAGIAHASPGSAIIPFRGEYYEIVPERTSLVKALIYPVPDPRFPFLGVHLTQTLSGKAKVGPNAILALKREGYRKTDFNLKDVFDFLRYPGFWRMARRYSGIGFEEASRSLFKRVFVQKVQRLLPELTSEDLVPGMNGVRAQALNADGTLLDDFHIVQQEGAIHVLNVPSPAATASLRIGEAISDIAQKAFSSEA